MSRFPQPEPKMTGDADGNRWAGLKSDDKKKTSMAILRPGALLERLKSGLKKKETTSLAPGSGLQPGGKLLAVGAGGKLLQPGGKEAPAAGGVKTGGKTGGLRFTLGSAVSLRPGGKDGSFKATGGSFPAGSRRTKKRRGDPDKVYTPSQLKKVMKNFQDFPFKGIDGVFGGEYGKDHWFNFKSEKKDDRQPTIYNSKSKSPSKSPKKRGEKDGKEGEEEKDGDAEKDDDDEDLTRSMGLENRAAKKWVPPTIRRQQQAEEAKNNPELQKKLRKEEITGTVRGYLNKLTPEKFETLSDQLIQWLEENIKDSEQLMMVVSLIFGKSIQEPKYGEMYARLCKKFHRPDSDKLVFYEGVGDARHKVEFRKSLLNQCQKEFEKGNDIPDITGSRKTRDAFIAKQKKAMMGTIKFIGQLYNQDLLPDRIMHECIKHLLSNNSGNASDEDLESVCQLIKASNKKLDTDVPRNRKLMNQYFRRLESYVRHSGYQKRTQILIRNLVDLRNNGWVLRVWQKAEEVRKLSELRSDFAKEKGISAGDMPNINLETKESSRSEINQLNVGGGMNNMMPTQALRIIQKSSGQRRNHGDRYAHQQAAMLAASAAANVTTVPAEETSSSTRADPVKSGENGAKRKKRFKLLTSSKTVVNIAKVTELAGPEKPKEEPRPPKPEGSSSPPPKQLKPTKTFQDPSLKIRRGGGKRMNRSQAKDALKLLLDEYYNNGANDLALEKAIKDLTKLMGSTNDDWKYDEVPCWIVDMGLNSIIPGARPLTGKLCVEFTNIGAFTPAEVQHGFHEVLIFFEDTMIDIPKFPEYIAEILAEAFVTKILTLEFVAKSLCSKEMTAGDVPACRTVVTDKLPFGLRAEFLSHLVTAMTTASDDADIGELLAKVDIAADYMGVTEQKMEAETMWISHYGFGDIL